MTFRPQHRLATVLLALVSLLFMQLAVAGYACPGGLKNSASSVNPAQLADMTAMVNAGMPCAEAMAATAQTVDDNQPALCHAHCKADPQSADTHQLPALTALADLPGDFSLPAPARASPAPPGVTLQAPLLRRHTAAPLTVRHCCFRL